MSAARDEAPAEFLRGVLGAGRAVIEPGSPWPAGDCPASLGVLEAAFAIHALGVGGPPVPFDPEVALAAVRVVHAACAALVDRSERPAALAARLAMPAPRPSASAHLSADLTLRFLAQVLRRARGLDADDPLASILSQTLRAWPLSGALADLAEPPTSPPDFGGHPGLGMLYAERLVRRGRESWYPGGGTTAEYLDLARWAAGNR